MKKLTPNATGIEGRVLRRGEEKYEHFRRGAVWHAGTPERYPEMIVVATSAEDVAGAARLAAAEGLQVAVRSGGHSWSGSHLRDGSLLIDLSNLRRVDVDVEAKRAVVQPGITGWELAAMLRAEDLFFPTGHSEGISVGGYLLQGGFGWMSRTYGPACMSVVGIDLVTADGSVVYADETTNADLLWAARGAGPGFFGVVTAFHLKLYPRKRFEMRSTVIYPLATFREVFDFIHRLDTPAELGVLVRRHEMANNDPIAVVTGIAYTDTEAEARSQLAAFEACPAFAQALHTELYMPMDYSHTDTDGGSRDEEKRWVADNMATHADFADLWPGMETILRDFPQAPSHLLLFNWGGYEKSYPRPSMAFSVEDKLFYGLYAAWDDKADDAAHVRWVTENMRAWEPFATGTMLADENLKNRPFKFVSDENLQRLDRLRAEWDPERRFVAWLGRPDAGQAG
jgi:FAD/FMN-containing dehydrogenase